MKSILLFSIIIILFIGIGSCKHETCPTYAESHFLSKKKYNKQIRQYQNGKLVKKMKAKKDKESGNTLKNSKTVQTKPVPKD